MTARVTLARALPPVYAVAAVRMLMPLLVLPLMAARVGIEEFGRLGLCLVWASLLALVVEGGFLAAATRQAVIADAARRLVLAQRVFSARCVLSVPVALAGLVVGAWLIPATGSTIDRWETAALLAGLACAQGWPATWYLQGSSQLHRWAWVELGVHGLLLGACLGWAHTVLVFLLLQWLAATTLALLGWQWLRWQLVGAPGGSPGAPAGASIPSALPALWDRTALRPGLALGWTMLPVSMATAGFTLALPAVAASQLGRAELGLYYLADRIVRALLAATDPLVQLVYPRIVERFAASARSAWVYAMRWAAAGLVLGLAIGLLGWLAWPGLRGLLVGIDSARLGAVLAVLGVLLPLVMGSRFLAYWVLGSARYDRAYRASIYAGAVVGVGGAWWLGGSAERLAGVAVAAELAILLVAALGVMLTRGLRRT